MNYNSPERVRRSSLSYFNVAPSAIAPLAGPQPSLVPSGVGLPSYPDAPYRNQPRTISHIDPRRGPPEWHIPIFNEEPRPGRGSRAYVEEPSARRSSLAPYSGPGEDRRGSKESERTLQDEEEKRYSLSSYKHPYDIPPPNSAYSGQPASISRSEGPRPRRSVSFMDNEEPHLHEQHSRGNDNDDIESGRGSKDHRDGKARPGVLSHLMDWHMNMHRPDEHDQPVTSTTRRPTATRNPSSEYSQLTMGYSTAGDYSRALRREDTATSFGSQALDEDDPRVTGRRREYLEDPEDLKRNALRQMDYRARRKERAKVRIEFNITSVINRQLFLLKLARALMTFGAPSHRIESQLMAAAKILEVDAEFIHLPGVIICSFGDEGTKTSETHFVKCSGRLSLGSLHKVHLIYRSVVHDEISAKEASRQLSQLLAAPPLYSIWFRCILAFWLSALICPLAFGGSFVDMWVAGVGAFILCLLQLSVATKSALYANVFEITIAIFMSFTARGLSSIKSSNQLFCYTAISSAGIVGILPGYLILSSSLELASKNIVCGSVKMVYALIYTLFLGFGLQIGSDLFLLIDPQARHNLQALAAKLASTTTLVGTFAVDDGTNVNTTHLFNSGTFTFTDTIPLSQKYVTEGCYRPPTYPWYLSPFPWWTQFIIVPLFSILSSLANLQPFWSKQLPVMTIISIASYTANKIANHYIFNRSDIVSAIGAFTVGILGNIYSRKMGGTAFTSMVTGVLFLVPSGLSQAGGITANGNGIDIGGAMIAVTIGITVGLFTSQAIVYMFGSRKNAAVFSF